MIKVNVMYTFFKYCLFYLESIGIPLMNEILFLETLSSTEENTFYVHVVCKALKKDKLRK